MAGTIIDVTFLGDMMHYTVRTAWAQDLVVRAPLDRALTAGAALGDPVRVEWDAEQSALFAAA